MDLKKLLAETLQASRAGAELPDYVGSDEPPEMVKPELEDLMVSEESPQDLETPEHSDQDLTVGRPDQHEETGLSLPELYEPVEGEPERPEPDSFALPEEPQVEGMPDVPEDSVLEAEQPQVPENLSSDTEQNVVEQDEDEPEPLEVESQSDVPQDSVLETETPQVPENLSSGSVDSVNSVSDMEPEATFYDAPEYPEEVEMPTYGVDRPESVADRNLEVEDPEGFGEQQLAVAGVVQQGLPEDQEAMQSKADATPDYASILREAMGDPLEEMGENFRNHAKDYMSEQVLMTQIYGDYT